MHRFPPHRTPCRNSEDRDTCGTTRACHGSSAFTANKAPLFPSPVFLTRTGPIIFWGKTVSSLRRALFERVGRFMLWEPGQREQHTHTYTHKYLHTQIEKPSGICNWQTHSRNSVEQSWTIATNTRNI